MSPTLVRVSRPERVDTVSQDRGYLHRERSNPRDQREYDEERLAPAAVAEGEENAIQSNQPHQHPPHVEQVEGNEPQGSTTSLTTQNPLTSRCRYQRW